MYVFVFTYNSFDFLYYMFSLLKIKKMYSLTISLEFFFYSNFLQCNLSPSITELLIDDVINGMNTFLNCNSNYYKILIARN